MDQWFHDVRYAVRTLLKAPAFTAVVTLTLAVGIGANSAIFSIVSALLLRPVAFEDVDRLVFVWEEAPRLNILRGSVAPATFRDWQTRSRVFESLAAFQVWDTTLTDGAQPEYVHGFVVSPAFFPLLRVKPALGRTFSPDEGEPGRDDVVVLSHGLWQRSFGGARELIGSPITVNGRRVTVIGVMPADFDFPLTTELWAPLALTAAQQQRRDERTLQVLARLAPGVPLAQANAEMTAIAGQLQQQYPDSSAGRTARVVALTEGLLDEVSPRFLLITMAAVAFVLLIVCANMASLLLARAGARSREIGIRVALGATRSRIVRQLLTDSLVLALVGGALGLGVAKWSIDVMMRQVPADVTRFIPGWHAIGLNAQVLGFTLLTSAACGLIFGLAPALQTSKVDIDESLKTGGRASIDRAGGRRARNVLVISEMALTLVLLMGAALLVTAFRHLASPSHGFDPHKLQTFRVTLPETRYGTRPQVRTFFTRALERVAALPDVVAVAAISDLPWHAGAVKDDVAIEGRAPARAGESLSADYRVVSANYFSSLRIPILKGRTLSEHDDERALGVVVISDTMARRFWPGQDPIGRRVKLGALESDAPWLLVVGVAADVKRFWWDSQSAPTAYVPLGQAPAHTMSLLIRTSVDPARVLGPGKDQVRAMDPELPIYHIETMEESAAESLMGVRLASGVMTAFAVLALLLSAIGIYGLVAYSVAQRTREIGVRIALGASPRNILLMVIGEGLTLAGVAIGIGLVVSFAVSRVMAAALFGIVPADERLLIALPIPLALAALAASYLPARKASRIDPIVALRHD